MNAAKKEIRKAIVILDRNDNEIPGPAWDINVASTDGSDGFVVDIYLERRQRSNETFKIKYNAKTISTGEVLYNHIEVINSTPYLVEGTDYSLTESTSGYLITGLASSDYAPGIGVFYTGPTTGEVVVTSTQIKLRKEDSTYAAVTYGETDKTVAKVVAELNELGLQYYRVTQLSPSTLSRFQTGTFSVSSAGTVLRLDQIVHLRYNEETRLRVLKPYNDPVTKPWYPRVDVGEFLQDYVGSDKLLFKIPEYDSQTWSYTHGKPYRDMVDDLPEIISEKMIQLRRRRIKDGSLTLKVDGKAVSIERDIDLLNGVVFLTITPRAELTADYAFEETSYVYTGIDLNTNALHNPDIFGKYIGIYVTPYKILGSAAQTFSTTVRHVIRDTYQEVVDQVDNVLFDDGTDPHAFLLGVFRPVLTAEVDDIKLVDTRVRGGGLADDVTSTDEPESDFFYDIGCWGGAPIADRGTVVVGVPDGMLGTGTYSIRASIPIPASGYYCPSGYFTHEYIQGVVNRHVAAGILPIIWYRPEL